ncbi:hypothetical protein Hypma_016192 [Hypsizygus marmoreus]|uniref:Uncharacterized protein n=1 Tax=Hypsizygus marmoreus TaxID=39966 RepID=A0A369J3G7_HYPMA|nr:hypothetical protein Hypma_016192 [Hypsizygus marmoreus]
MTVFKLRALPLVPLPCPPSAAPSLVPLPCPPFWPVSPPLVSAFLTLPSDPRLGFVVIGGAPLARLVDCDWGPFTYAPRIVLGAAARSPVARSPAARSAIARSPIARSPIVSTKSRNYGVLCCSAIASLVSSKCPGSRVRL